MVELNLQVDASPQVHNYTTLRLLSTSSIERQLYNDCSTPTADDEKDMQYLNYCRLYMNVISISDVTDEEGNFIRSDNLTSFRAEIDGCRAATEMLRQFPHSKYIKLFCDNQAVIK